MATSPDLIVEGLDVESSVFPGEAAYASSAEFRVRNNGPAALVAITSVEFAANGRAFPITAWHVYAGDRELQGGIRIPSDSELLLRITFPFIEVHAGSTDSYRVTTMFSTGAEEYTAVSHLRFIQELE